MKKHHDNLRQLITTVVPAGVLTWALAVLTISYMGFAKVDAAFISSLVTSVLAVYGVSRKEEDKKERTARTRSAPTIPKSPRAPKSPPPATP